MYLNGSLILPIESNSNSNFKMKRFSRLIDMLNNIKLDKNIISLQCPFIFFDSILKYKLN